MVGRTLGSEARGRAPVRARGQVSTAERLKLRINISRSAAFRSVAGDIFEITNLTTAWAFFRWFCCLNSSFALPALPIRIVICLQGCPKGGIATLTADCLYLTVIFATYLTYTLFLLCHSLLLIIENVLSFITLPAIYLKSNIHELLAK